MLTPKKYKSALFSWEPVERCFYTEVCRLAHISESPFGPLADNRHGFFMQSDRTGNEVCFRIGHVNWSADDEILSWVLFPSQEEIARDPTLKDVQCIIYND